MIPVELASFAATANFGVVELQWITAKKPITRDLKFREVLVANSKQSHSLTDTEPQQKSKLIHIQTEVLLLVHTATD